MTVIAAHVVPEVSYWIETPRIPCGAPTIWTGGKNTEEMFRRLLADHDTVSPADILYVDTFPPRIKCAKHWGLATCARVSSHNPFAEKPLWPILQIGDVALIAAAQQPRY